MVSAASVEQQLKKLNFKPHGWGRAEVKELQHILVPDEEIYECTNGMYEGGFALLVATDIRVILIDKKPLNYLTVEDLRFDMINEIDYSHRLMGASINIATGSKNLSFHSYNQPRLRKLITHVQHCMAEAKKKQSSHQEGQNQNLEQIKEQLQTYLAAQQAYQQQLHSVEMARQAGQQAPPMPQPVRPPGRLSDFLLAQSLLAQHKAETGRQDLPIESQILDTAESATQVSPPVSYNQSQIDDIYNEGLKEVFGDKQLQLAQPTVPAPITPLAQNAQPEDDSTTGSLDVNAFKIASSKLPMLLRNRKFGRPSIKTSQVMTKPVEP